MENVKGLTRASFADYFRYILARLEMPDVVSAPNESWQDHAARLARIRQSSAETLRYNVSTALVNAADYGVPQLRHRVFLVGLRSDLDKIWTPPTPTHSKEALLWSQWVSGEYWTSRRVPRRLRPDPPSEGTLRRLATLDKTEFGLPWLTVHDGLVGLGTPRPGGSRTYHNHVFQPGARSYPGHTGSPLHWPAKTLKAGGNGVPGGENMIRYPDGLLRYFSVRESARIQTFPDDYRFWGSWTETMRQLGNAVPVTLAEVMASSVAAVLT